MIETFLKKNWRTVIFLGVVLFAWLVWPTPYYYYKGKDDARFRQNRFTGTTESYWGGLGQWRCSDWESFHKAKQEDDSLKKKTEGDATSK